MQPDYEHCAALVRERDREFFLSTLYAPAGKRPHLFALYAFGLEVARVPDAVRDPMAGEIRLQWWREALSGERPEETSANPVAAALADTARRCALPPRELIAAIDAWQFDLSGQPMETRTQLDDYLIATRGRLIGLAARILEGEGNGRDVAEQAGRAIGLTRILQSFAFDTSKGRLFVPLDLLASHGVHTASVMGGEVSAGLHTALAEMRGWAMAAHASLEAASVSAVVLPAVLPAALTPLYMARMEKAAYDPFRSDVSVSAFRTQFALWRAARSGGV